LARSPEAPNTTTDSVDSAQRPLMEAEAVAEGPGGAKGEATAGEEGEVEGEVEGAAATAVATPSLLEPPPGAAARTTYEGVVLKRVWRGVEGTAAAVTGRATGEEEARGAGAKGRRGPATEGARGASLSDWGTIGARGRWKGEVFQLIFSSSLRIQACGAKWGPEREERNDLRSLVTEHEGFRSDTQLRFGQRERTPLTNFIAYL
jgi:hypothetical protein